MAIRTPRLAPTFAVLAILNLTACTKGDAPRDSAADTTSAASPEQDERVVKRYVEALNDGDIDAAMVLRCRSARVPAENLELFADQLDRLMEQAGPISVASVKPTPPSGLQASEAGTTPRELEYVLAVRGKPVQEPLRTVVVGEAGERTMCAIATRQAEQLHRVLTPALIDRGDADRELSQLMPSLDDPRYVQTADEPLEPRRDRGQTHVWQRVWAHDEHGGARTDALRFASAEDASEYADTLLRDVFSDAVEVFTLPGIDGPVGVRFLAYAWLWVQPPSHGPFIDRVVVLFGRTVVVTQVSNLPTGADHRLITDLASQVFNLAGSH